MHAIFCNFGNRSQNIISKQIKKSRFQWPIKRSHSRWLRRLPAIRSGAVTSWLKWYDQTGNLCIGRWRFAFGQYFIRREPGRCAWWLSSGKIIRIFTIDYIEIAWRRFIRIATSSRISCNAKQRRWHQRNSYYVGVSKFRTSIKCLKLETSP